MSNLSVRQSLAITLSGQKIPVYITKEEVDKMLQVIQEEIMKARERRQKNRTQVLRRNYIFIKALFQTGARVSELLLLTPSMINRTEKTIRLPNLKRHKKKTRGRPAKDTTPYVEKIIPLSDSLRADISDYCLDYGIGPESKLFPFTRRYAHKLVSEIGEKAGVPKYKCHPHAFRHGFAVYCLLSGVPITVVQEWLGHSSIINTTIYTKITQLDNRGFFENIVW